MTLCPVCQRELSGFVHLCLPARASGHPPGDHSPERILQLADAHLARYGRMLEASVRSPRDYNVIELHGLIAAWSSVRAKGGIYDTLDEVERNEVDDAIADEDDDGADASDVVGDDA